MRTRVRLLPYRRGSATARALARQLGLLRLHTVAENGHVRTRFRPRPTDVILNWGSHKYPTTEHVTAGMAPRYINRPQAVYRARDKLACFRKLSEQGVPTVEWTDNWALADQWLYDGSPVLLRLTTTGQGGAGIVVVRPDNLPPGRIADAPLYTKYFKAKHEARVHVVNGQTLAQKKRRREGVEPNMVRNHANGYVYCTGNFTCPANVVDVAKRAVAALELEFGAVDLLYTNDGEVRVLEVNSAPGLEGSTLDWYADRFREVLA